MSVDQAKKTFCSICEYCFVKWWVKLKNISSSIFCFLTLIFLVYLKSTLNPLFFRVSSNSHFAVLNISSLDKFFDSLRWMEFGICFMMLG